MDPQLFTNQAIIAVIASWLLEKLKASPRIGLISHQSSMYVQRYAAAIVAFATSLGIHFQFDHQAGTLLITGLSLASLGHFVWGAVQQFIMQEVAYQKLVKPAPPAPVTVVVGQPMPLPTVGSGGV